MKVLITGRKDKLWKAVGAAFSRQQGFSVTVVPSGSSVIESLRSSPLDAVLYTLSSSDDIELLRWILTINPSVALVAVVPAKESLLRKQVAEEGIAQVAEVAALGPAQIRSSVAPMLRNLAERSGGEARRQISDDLHAIRSALTAILGNAEMALKRISKTAASRKQLEEIPRGVLEIERILRRLHRTVGGRALETPPSSVDRKNKK